MVMGETVAVEELGVLGRMELDSRFADTDIVGARRCETSRFCSWPTGESLGANR